MRPRLSLALLLAAAAVAAAAAAAPLDFSDEGEAPNEESFAPPRFAEERAAATASPDRGSHFAPVGASLLQGKIRRPLPAAAFKEPAAAQHFAAGLEGIIVRDSFRSEGLGGPLVKGGAYNPAAFPLEGLTHVIPYQFVAEIVLWEATPCAGTVVDPSPPRTVYNQLFPTFGQERHGTPAPGSFVGATGGVVALQNCLQAHGVRHGNVAAPYPDPTAFFGQLSGALSAASDGCVVAATGALGQARQCAAALQCSAGWSHSLRVVRTFGGHEPSDFNTPASAKAGWVASVNGEIEGAGAGASRFATVLTRNTAAGASAGSSAAPQAGAGRLHADLHHVCATPGAAGTCGDYACESASKHVADTTPELAARTCFGQFHCQQVCCVRTCLDFFEGDKQGCPASSAGKQRNKDAVVCGEDCAEVCCTEGDVVEPVKCADWTGECAAGRRPNPGAAGTDCEGDAQCEPLCCRDVTCQDWHDDEDGECPAHGRELEDKSSVKCGTADRKCDDVCCLEGTCATWAATDGGGCDGEGRIDKLDVAGTECKESECAGECCRDRLCEDWLKPKGSGTCAAGQHEVEGAEALEERCGSRDRPCAEQCCKPDTCADWRGDRENTCGDERHQRDQSDGLECSDDVDGKKCADVCCVPNTCAHWRDVQKGDCKDGRAHLEAGEEVDGKDCGDKDDCEAKCCADLMCSDFAAPPRSLKCAAGRKPLADATLAATKCASPAQFETACCADATCRDWTTADGTECQETHKKTESEEKLGVPCVPGETCETLCCEPRACADWEGKCPADRRDVEDSASEPCHNDATCLEACCELRRCRHWAAGGGKCADAEREDKEQAEQPCHGEACAGVCCKPRDCDFWRSEDGGANKCAGDKPRDKKDSGAAACAGDACADTCCEASNCGHWWDLDNGECADGSKEEEQQRGTACATPEACQEACCSDHLCEDWRRGPKADDPSDDRECPAGTHDRADSEKKACSTDAVCVAECCAKDTCADWRALAGKEGAAAGVGECPDKSQYLESHAGKECHGEEACEAECCADKTCADFFGETRHDTPERDALCGEEGQARGGVEAEPCHGEECLTACCEPRRCVDWFDGGKKHCADGTLPDADKEGDKCHGDDKCQAACCQPQTCSLYFGTPNADGVKPTCPDLGAPLEGKEDHVCADAQACERDCCSKATCGDFFDKSAGECTNKAHKRQEARDGDECVTRERCGAECCAPKLCEDWLKPKGQGVCESGLVENDEARRTECTDETCPGTCCRKPTCADWFKPAEEGAAPRQCPEGAGDRDTGRDGWACSGDEECAEQCCRLQCKHAWEDEALCQENEAHKSAAGETYCEKGTDCAAKCCEPLNCAVYWEKHLGQDAERCPSTHSERDDPETIACGTPAECSAGCCEKRTCLTWETDGGECLDKEARLDGTDGTGCVGDAQCRDACCPKKVPIVCADYWASPNCPDGKTQSDAAGVAGRGCEDKSPGGDCERWCCQPREEPHTCTHYWSEAEAAAKNDAGELPAGGGVPGCAAGQVKDEDNAGLDCVGDHCAKVCCAGTCASWEGTCAADRDPVAPETAGTVLCEDEACAAACCTPKKGCDWFVPTHGCGDGTTEKSPLPSDPCGDKDACQGACCRDTTCRDVWGLCATNGGGKPKTSAADEKCADTEGGCPDECCEQETCEQYWGRSECPAGPEGRTLDRATNDCKDEAHCLDYCCHDVTEATTCGKWKDEDGNTCTAPMVDREGDDVKRIECDMPGTLPCAEACCEPKGDPATCANFFDEKECPSDTVERRDRMGVGCEDPANCAATCCDKCECDPSWLTLRAGGPFESAEQCCEGTCASFFGAENSAYTCSGDTPKPIDDPALLASTKCNTPAECLVACCRPPTCADYAQEKGGTEAACPAARDLEWAFDSAAEAADAPCDGTAASCEPVCCTTRAPEVDTCETFKASGGTCGGPGQDWLPGLVPADVDCKGAADCRRKCCSSSCALWLGAGGGSCRASLHEVEVYKDDPQGAAAHLCRGLQCQKECCNVEKPVPTCADFWRSPKCRAGTRDISEPASLASLECGSNLKCQHDCCRDNVCSDYWGETGCPTSHPKEVAERANEPCHGLACPRQCCANEPPPQTCRTWLGPPQRNQCKNNVHSSAPGYLDKVCGTAPGQQPCAVVCCGTPPPPRKCKQHTCYSGTKPADGVEETECGFSPATCQAKCCVKRTCLDLFAGAGCGDKLVKKSGVLQLPCGLDPQCRKMCCDVEPPHTCKKWRASFEDGSEPDHRCVKGTSPKPNTDGVVCTTKWQCRERCCKPDTCTEFWAGDEGCPEATHVEDSRHALRPCVGALCRARCCRPRSCADHYASPDCDEAAEVRRFTAQVAARTPCGPAGCAQKCCKPKPHKCVDFWGAADGGCPATHGPLKNADQRDCKGRADCVKKCCGAKTCAFWHAGSDCQPGFVERRDPVSMAKRCVGDEQCHPKCCRQESCLDYFKRPRPKSEKACGGGRVPKWRTYSDKGVRSTLCGPNCEEQCCMEPPPTCGDFFKATGCDAATSRPLPNVGKKQCSGDEKCQESCCRPTTCADYLGSKKCPADRLPLPLVAVGRRACAGEACAAECCRKRTCLDFFEVDKRRCPANHKSKFRLRHSAKATACGTDCEAVCCGRVETCASFMRDNGCLPGRFGRPGTAHLPCAGASCEPQCCASPTCGSFWATTRCPAGLFERRSVPGLDRQPCGGGQDCAARCCAARSCLDYYRSPGCNRGFGPVFRNSLQAAGRKCGNDPQCHAQCCGQIVTPPTCSAYQCQAGSVPRRDVAMQPCTGLACQQLCCAPTTCQHFWASAGCPAGSGNHAQAAMQPCVGAQCAQTCCRQPTCGSFFAGGGRCHTGSKQIALKGGPKALSARPCQGGQCQDSCCVPEAPPTCAAFFATSACTKGRLPDRTRAGAVCTGTQCQDVCCAPNTCRNFWAGADCGQPSSRRPGAEQTPCEGLGCQTACCEMPPYTCGAFVGAAGPGCPAGTEPDPAAPLAATECSTGGMGQPKGKASSPPCEEKCCRQRTCGTFAAAGGQCAAGHVPRAGAHAQACGAAGAPPCEQQCCERERTCHDFFAGSDCPPAKRRKASAPAGLACGAACEQQCCEARPTCADWWSAAECPAGTRTGGAAVAARPCEGAGCAQQCCRPETCADFFGAQGQCPAGKRPLQHVAARACVGAACAVECCGGGGSTCGAWLATETCGAGRRATPRPELPCEGDMCREACCVSEPPTCATWYAAEECAAGFEPLEGAAHAECGPRAPAGSPACAAACCRPSDAVRPTCGAFVLTTGCAAGTEAAGGDAEKEPCGDDAAACQAKCCRAGPPDSCGEFFKAGGACEAGHRAAEGGEDRACVGDECKLACCEKVEKLTCARFVARDGCEEGHEERPGHADRECEEDECGGVCCRPVAEPTCGDYFRDGAARCPTGQSRRGASDHVPCTGDEACAKACCEQGQGTEPTCALFFDGGGRCEGGLVRLPKRDTDLCAASEATKGAAAKGGGAAKGAAAKGGASKAKGGDSTPDCAVQCCGEDDVSTDPEPEVLCAEFFASDDACEHGTSPREGADGDTCAGRDSCRAVCCHRNDRPPETCAQFYAEGEEEAGAAKTSAKKGGAPRGGCPAGTRRAPGADARECTGRDCAERCCVPEGDEPTCAQFYAKKGGDCAAGTSRREGMASAVCHGRECQTECCSAAANSTCGAFFQRHECGASTVRRAGRDAEACAGTEGCRAHCCEAAGRTCAAHFAGQECPAGQERRPGFAGIRCEGAGQCESKCCEPAATSCDGYTCADGERRREGTAGTTCRGDACAAKCCEPAGGTCTDFFKRHKCRAGQARAEGKAAARCVGEACYSTCCAGDAPVKCAAFFASEQCREGTVRRAGYERRSCRGGGDCQQQCCEAPGSMTCEIFHESGGCPYGTSLRHTAKSTACSGELACIAECCDGASAPLTCGEFFNGSRSCPAGRAPRSGEDDTFCAGEEQCECRCCEEGGGAPEENEYDPKKSSESDGGQLRPECKDGHPCAF